MSDMPKGGSDLDSLSGSDSLIESRSNTAVRTVNEGIRVGITAIYFRD